MLPRMPPLWMSESRSLKSSTSMGDDKEEPSCLCGLLVSGCWLLVIGC